ncbi:hypothetical protein Q1695_003750 [Nippostrongylus brasiliensis]|nr:hypothetical protein Q1695_003750 [Nippostrongylus brasiliensis]
MTSNCRQKKVECGLGSLVGLAILVLLAVAVAAVLSYFLTRNAWDPSRKHDGSHRTADNSPTAAELRLPTSIEPLHYDLTIKTYLPFYVDFPAKKNLTFDGRIEIKMKIIDSTRKIVLNAKNISVIAEDCELSVDEEKIAIAKVKMVERLEKVEFVLASKIPKDSLAHLKIVYTGLISNTLGGLYQTIYTEADGKTRIAAVTHMEPSDARRLVPCFDEPAFKANWTVTVIHPKGTKAVSNGIEKNGEGEKIGDWIVSKFETTPRMSSYLLAIFVSEFDFVEGHTKSGVRFRIWSRPEAKEMTIYAKDAAIKCLEFYEDYYDIKFPLRKQDMVALPDFSMGAMENWGLITYRENSLLYDDRYYAPRNKKRVAMVVAHELAHQWFGNLVTLKWWDDLWLNEGFAAMVEFLGVDEITNKNMRIKEYFLLYAVDVGLGADRVASSHPLSFRIDKASEVTEAFDSITYRKGASVLQMVSALIGEGNFKKAIIHYLKKFSYSNAKASDLWNSFDEIVTDVPGPRSSSLKVSDFADQWITQMGFPLVTVESFNATSAKITQSRYKTRKNAEDPPKYRNPRYGFQWDVPIWYQNSNDRKVKVTWLTRDEPLFIHVENTEEPLVVNADRRGFYRQNYDTNGWKKIIKQLKRDHSVYSPQTRNAIISDAFAAALVDKLDYTTLFELLEYARNETEYLPWMEIMAGFQSILEYFGNEPESKPAMSYMMSVLKPMYDNVNMKSLADRYKDEEVFVEMSLQQAVLSAFCSLGSKDCIEKFRALFDKEVSQKCGTGDKASKCVSVAAPLRQAMYCYGVKEGGEIAFKKVMRLYYAESVQLEKDYLLTALGCSNDITSLKELLLLALDRNSSFARLQDVAGVFRAVSANPLGREFMFNFLVDRWEDIVNSFKAEHKAVYVAITECSRGIRTKQQLEQLRTLQKEGLLAEKYGAFDEAIENAEDRVEWIEKHFRNVADFFKKAADRDNGTTDNSPTAAELRLPANVEPLHYELTIKTYLPFYVDFPANKNLTTDGHLEIYMKVISSTNTIVLNAKNITVLAEKCELFVNNEKIAISKVNTIERLEKVEFVLAKRLPNDSVAHLKIEYTGIISDTLGGLYQTTYKETKEATKIAAATHMEPSDARLMVPCFDEPVFKANWTVTVIHPKGTKAVSNGIENGEGERSGDWIISKFKTTPRMSSYLLAIFVSEFDYVEGHTSSGVRFRIWSRPEAKEMTAYAKDAAIKCLEFYENYYDIKFPLPKQDMVALPDFSSGAMENWGLITYRENSLLYDPRYYGQQNKKRVAMVIAHELAHQWFGNLVTLKWWDDLWLNEGFASMVEFLGVDNITDKNMRIREYFLLYAIDEGLEADRVASSHPLSFKIDKAADVTEAFDDITYRKGASVLEMVSAVVGEENFKKAITHYLKKFSYANAQASDLWTSFDEIVTDVPGPRGSPLKVSDFADQWIVQMGFPLVTVESFNATSVKITQSRYKTNENAEELPKYRKPKYGFKWDVPVWYQNSKDKNVKVTWLTRDEPLFVHLDKPEEPFVVNADRHGFYRQNYDSSGWQKIIKQLKEDHEVYSSRTRNAIISDAFAAALVEKLDYVTLFELLEYVKKETEYLPVEETMDGFRSILEYFGSEPESRAGMSYMRSILKPLYDKINMTYLANHYREDELFFEMNLEQAVLATYCKLGSRDCIEKFRTLFDKEVAQKCRTGEKASECVTVAAPLRQTMYCNGVKEGGEIAFEKVMSLYNAETVQLEKDYLLAALGCHNDITALKGLLLLALDRNSSFVRLQDVASVFRVVSSNPVGQEFMFNFLIERWEDILNGVKGVHRVVNAIIPPCTRGIRTEQQIGQLRTLQKEGLHAKEYGAFNEQIEKAEYKVEWIKKHYRELADFFQKALPK